MRVNTWQWLMLLQFCYFAQKQTEKDSEKEKPSDTQLWYYSPHGWAAAFRLGISNINCNFSVSNSLNVHRISTKENTIKKPEKINIFRMLSLCILKTIRMSTDKSAMIENTESPPVRNPAQLSTLTLRSDPWISDTNRSCRPPSQDCRQAVQVHWAVDQWVQWIYWQRCKKLQMLQIYLCYFFSVGANLWAILGHFWANLGNFGSFWGYFG